MIRARSVKVPVLRCCKLLRVSRALVYFSPKPEGPHPLAEDIERVSGESPAYGYRRVAKQLQKEGSKISEKQTRLQMKKMGLLRAKKRRKAQTTYSVPVSQANVAKGFISRRPNELWVSDITYVPFGKRGFAYLAVVMDAFSRRIVGHSVSRSLHSELCVRALGSALQKRNPALGWIHHSDRGSQYASCAYRELVESHGGTLSFSGIGKPRDNALAESFFRTLKTEEVFMNEYESFEAAAHAMGRFIDEEYNRRRLHSSLGYETPVGFETLKAEERQILSV